jgi:hypothetical protein
MAATRQQDFRAFIVHRFCQAYRPSVETQKAQPHLEFKTTLDIVAWRPHNPAGARHGQKPTPVGIGCMCAMIAVRRPGPAGGNVLCTRANRGGEHPAHDLAGYAGILWADAYAGYDKPPIVETECWLHARRHCSLALKAVRRIDALFAVERSINGQSAERRRQVRHKSSVPLVRS